MGKLKFENGDSAEIMFLDFELVMRLKRAIGRELQASGKDKINFENFDFQAKFTSEMLQQFISIIICIDSSEEVFALLMECLSRCLYNGEKITERTFETEKARENYYALIKEVLQVNLSPFLKGALSRFVEIMQKVLN